MVLVFTPTDPHSFWAVGYIYTDHRKHTRKSGEVITTWYHRTYYKNDSGKEVYKPFRCRKANPKKCNGEYGTDNYCQAYREAEKELNHREGQKTIDIANLTDLPDAHKVQLLEALAIAQKNDISLTTLVRSAETAQGPVKHIRLVEAREVYLEALLDNDHKAQHKKASGITNELINHFHDIGLHELDMEGIRKWAKGVKRWSNGHKNRSLKCLVSFWNHFKSLQYSLPEHNPFAFADSSKGKPGLKYFPVVEEPKDTLTVRECKKVLRQALTHPVTAAVVVLVLVCGVRSEEAARLCWADIELDDDPMVYISPRNAKKFRPSPDGKVRTATRHIELTPQQVAWLRAAKESGGELPVTQSTFNKRLTGNNYPGWREVEGISPWLKGRQNVLRHTYCSMHVAHFKSIGLTAHYAGNSERTIRLNYLDVLKPTDAVAFWELIP